MPHSRVNGYLAGMNSASIFQRVISLRNDFVELAPLGLQHVEGLLNIALEEDLWRYGSYCLRSEEDLIEYIDRAIAERRSGSAYPFVLIERQSGRLAGSSRFCHFSWPDRRLEIGYTWLGKPFRQTALNRATKTAMLGFAFDVLGMERVEFKTDSRNTASRNALLGIGAVEEGTLRSHQVNWDGYQRDTVYFSIVSKEWPERQRSELRAFIAQPAPF